MAILENHLNNEVQEGGPGSRWDQPTAPLRRPSVRAALEVNSHSDAVVPQLLLLPPPMETPTDHTMMAIESLKCAILTEVNEINRCPSIITMTVVNRSVRQKLHRCDCHTHPWIQ